MTLVRPAQPADRESILAVVRAAFGSEEEVDLVRGVWASSGYLSDLELLAESDGKVVGHVLHSVGMVGPHRLAALAPLAVAPAHQRQGVGSALVRESIRRAEWAGWPMIVLLGHPEYYPRFGFEPAMGLGLTYQDRPGPFPAFQARRLAGYDLGIRGRFQYVWEME
ncbi:MAG: GNAT family N-acetyltransferase [Acidimicrobiales bacterium]